MSAGERTQSVEGEAGEAGGAQAPVGGADREHRAKARGDLPPEWAAIVERLGRAGLNAWGVADGAPWQEVLPGCRSVVVFASGGDALWSALLDDLRADPRGLTEQDHPLDAFARRQLQAADPAPGPTRRWVRCAGDADLFVDFRPLALDAGLGWPSRLGLLLNPSYGLWMGLRAACFTTERLPRTGALSGGGPCATCPAPCAAACPAAAVAGPDRPVHGERPTFDIRRCAAFHDESDLCADTCHARLACPEGAGHAYPPLERRYHYDRANGRRALAEHLRIADARTGTGPFWDDWSG